MQNQKHGSDKGRCFNHFFFFLSLFKVFANLALRPNFPDFLAALLSFLAGIFFPFLTPRAFLKAPGFLMAFFIFNFFSAINYQLKMRHIIEAFPILRFS